jgi:hypothetical protein
MNVDNLRQRALPRDVDPFDGWWAPIEFQPDIFVDQRFTVGVIVGNGSDHAVRTMSSVGRFTCVYGKAMLEGDLVWALQQAQESARRQIAQWQGGSGLDLGSPHFHLGAVRPVRGSSAAVLAARLFDEQVVMALSQHAKSAFATQDNSDLRKTLKQLLRGMAGFRYDTFAPTEDGLTIMEGGRLYRFDIDFDDSQRIGAVVSGWTTNKATFEMNLLRAESELYSYQRIRQRSQTALFVKIPEDDPTWPADARASIMGMWDELEWKLEQAGVHVISDSSNEKLAEHVLEYYT